LLAAAEAEIQLGQPEQAKRYSELGLSSITTNKPGQIKKWLQAS
jgi:phosphoribosyl-dephospho-CoA transferase